MFGPSFLERKSSSSSIVSEDDEGEDGETAEIFWAGKVGSAAAASAIALRSLKEARRLERSKNNWLPCRIGRGDTGFKVEYKPVMLREWEYVYRARLDVGLPAQKAFAYLCSEEGYKLIDPGHGKALVSDVSESFLEGDAGFDPGLRGPLQLEWGRPLAVGWPYAARARAGLAARCRRRRVACMKAVLPKRLRADLTRELAARAAAAAAAAGGQEGPAPAAAAPAPAPAAQALIAEETFSFQVRATGVGTCELVLLSHLQLGGRVPRFVSDAKCRELLGAMMERLDKYFFYEESKTRSMGVFPIAEENEEDVAMETLRAVDQTKDGFFLSEDEETESDSDPEDLLEFAMLQTKSSETDVLKSAIASVMKIVDEEPANPRSSPPQRPQFRRGGSSRFNVIQKKAVAPLTTNGKGKSAKAGIGWRLVKEKKNLIVAMNRDRVGSNPELPPGAPKFVLNSDTSTVLRRSQSTDGDVLGYFQEQSEYLSDSGEYFSEGEAGAGPQIRRGKARGRAVLGAHKVEKPAKSTMEGGESEPKSAHHSVLTASTKAFFGVKESNTGANITASTRVRHRSSLADIVAEEMEKYAPHADAMASVVPDQHPEEPPPQNEATSLSAESLQGQEKQDGLEPTQLSALTASTKAFFGVKRSNSAGAEEIRKYAPPPDQGQEEKDYKEEVSDLDDEPSTLLRSSSTSMDWKRSSSTKVVFTAPKESKSASPDPIPKRRSLAEFAAQEMNKNVQRQGSNEGGSSAKDCHARKEEDTAFLFTPSSVKPLVASQHTSSRESSSMERKAKRPGGGSAHMKVGGWAMCSSGGEAGAEKQQGPTQQQADDDATTAVATAGCSIKVDQKLKSPGIFAVAPSQENEWGGTSVDNKGSRGGVLLVGGENQDQDDDHDDESAASTAELTNDNIENGHHEDADSQTLDGY